IVIIGAGVTGLRCAQLLKAALGDDRVVVVEASGEVGGRIKQDRELFPSCLYLRLQIDLGAEIAHGSDTSISRLATERGWVFNSLFTWAQGDGGPLPVELEPESSFALYYLGRSKEMLRWDSQDPDFLQMNEFFASLHETTAANETDGDPRTLRAFLIDHGISDRMLGMADAGYANTVGGTVDLVGAAGICHLERNWCKSDGEGD
ncbi:unnamed protein product, partial [Phaeothamnion confervicola]